MHKVIMDICVNKHEKKIQKSLKRIMKMNKEEQKASTIIEGLINKPADAN